MIKLGYKRVIAQGRHLVFVHFPTTCDHSSHKTVHASLYVNYRDCSCLESFRIACRVACENSSFSSLLAAGHVSRGGAKRLQRLEARRNGCFRRLPVERCYSFICLFAGWVFKATEASAWVRHERGTCYGGAPLQSCRTRPSDSPRSWNTKQNDALLRVKSSTSCGPYDCYDHCSPSRDTCNWLAVSKIFSPFQAFR